MPMPAEAPVISVTRLVTIQNSYLKICRSAAFAADKTIGSMGEQAAHRMAASAMLRERYRNRCILRPVMPPGHVKFWSCRDRRGAVPAGGQTAAPALSL